MGLQDDFGCWRDNVEDIETIVLDYYTSIFQSGMPSTFAAVEEALEPKVTPEMNAAFTTRNLGLSDVFFSDVFKFATISDIL